MGPNISYRNVHTGLRQGKEPVSIVSYCAGPIPCTGTIPVPGQCDQAKTLEGNKLPSVTYSNFKNLINAS